MSDKSKSVDKMTFVGLHVSVSLPEGSCVVGNVVELSFPQATSNKDNMMIALVFIITSIVLINFSSKIANTDKYVIVDTRNDLDFVADIWHSSGTKNFYGRLRRG